MKQISILTIVLSFLIFNCGNRIQKRSELKTIDTLLNSEIGYEEAGQFQFSVSSLSLLNAYKNSAHISDLKNQDIQFKIIDVEGIKYLRVYSKNDIVSTINLIKTSKNIYKTGTTMCTSQLNESGESCVPDGIYCSKLSTDKNNVECIRTTAMTY